MATPGYLWMKDEHGQLIKSISMVAGREGSAEVYSARHRVSIPTDSHTGSLTGTRRHDPFVIVKSFCSATPILNKACCSGKTLQEVKVCWYRINQNGKEEEYFRQTLNQVKVVAVMPMVIDIKDPAKEGYGHLEEVHFRYEKIQWLYLDGNIATEDEWKERA